MLSYIMFAINFCKREKEVAYWKASVGILIASYFVLFKVSDYFSFFFYDIHADTFS